MGRLSGIIQLGPMSPQESLSEGGRRIRARGRREDGSRGSESEGESTMFHTAGFVAGGRGRKPRNAGVLQNLGKSRTRILP